MIWEKLLHKENQTVSARLITLPNIICTVRLTVSPLMIYSAFLQNGKLFFWLFICLTISDWLDGKLAIVLNQRSRIGPLLDTVADASMYISLLAGCIIMYSGTLLNHIFLLSVAIISYTISVTVSLLKFKRWPSYHTIIAKISWFLMIFGAMALLRGWNLWPFKLALIGVTLNNLEGIIITIILPQSRENVISIYQVFRDRRHN